MQSILTQAQVIWEDLVRDFLELACALTDSEQDTLIRALKYERIEEDHIDVHPTFSLGQHIVVITTHARSKVCWLYNPKKKTLKKLKIK